MGWVIREGVFIHSFSDNNGVALFNECNFELVALQLPIDTLHKLLQNPENSIDGFDIQQTKELIANLLNKEFIEANEHKNRPRTSAL